MQSEVWGPVFVGALRCRWESSSCFLFKFLFCFWKNQKLRIYIFFFVSNCCEIKLHTLMKKEDFSRYDVVFWTDYIMWSATRGYIISYERPIKEHSTVYQDVSPSTQTYLLLEIVSYQFILILRSKVDASESTNILSRLITFHSSSTNSFSHYFQFFIQSWYWNSNTTNKKSRIRETPTLSTDADSRTDTNLKRKQDLSKKNNKNKNVFFFQYVWWFI